MSEPEFQPGFRFSVLDSVVLMVGAVVSVMSWQQTVSVGFVVAFVFGHFFVFCNVFRVSRSLELAWAGLFVAVVASTVVTEIPGWPIAITLSLFATGTIIAIEMRKPSYHGVCWKRINPDLQKWWEEQNALLRGKVSDSS